MINTCYPARIISFDPLTQTAVVKLVIEKFFSNLDENYVADAAAELTDVPCHFPQGGGHAITMPVIAGDNCLVFFAQRGTDHWVYEDLDEAGSLADRPSPQHKRSHSQSDALALIGFGSGIIEKTKVITDFKPDAIEIRNVDRTQRVSLIVDSKDIEVVTDTNLTATIGGDVLATVTGNVVAIVDGDINSTSTNATVEATGVITLAAPNILLDGDVEFTGKMLDKNGIDHVVHKHDKGNYLDAESRPLQSGDSGVPK